MRKMTPTNILDELMPTTSEASDIAAALRWDYDQLGTAAAEVRCHAVEIKRNERKANEHVIEAGRHLIAVKDRLDHGQWGDWLTTEFSMTDRTARTLMSIAERFDGKTEIISDLTPTVLGLLASPSVPDAAIDEVRTAPGKVSVKQVKEIIAKHKPAPPSLPPITLPSPAQYGTVQPKVVEIVPADDRPLPDWVTGDSRQDQMRRYAQQFEQTITALDEWGQMTGHNTDTLCCLRELRKLIAMTQRELSLLRGEVVEEAWGE